VSNPGSVPHAHTADKDAVDLETRTHQDLGRLYLKDSRPWVVAFSGGKDSTLVLQLVYELLVELGEKAHKPVFVVTTDTGVEAPNVSAYVNGVLEVIRDHARAARLPLDVRLVRPTPAQSFWGKLIGQRISLAHPVVPLVHIQHEDQACPGGH